MKFLLVLLLLLPLQVWSQTSTAYPGIVNNMEALRAIPVPATQPSVIMTKQVLGYYVPGDLGGGTYILTNTISGTNKYGGLILGNGGNASWLLVDSTWTDKQFGCKGDNTQDETDRLNTLLNTKNPRLCVASPGVTNLISDGLDQTNSNVIIDWYGTIRCATNVHYHIFQCGFFTNTMQLFVTNLVNGRSIISPNCLTTNLVIDGHGTGLLDGNAGESLEYFTNTTTAPLYGGHGIHVRWINGVIVRGMKSKSTPLWGIAVERCINSLVDNCSSDNSITLRSIYYPGKNNDAIHFLDCQEAVGHKLFGSASDDCFAITGSLCDNFNISLRDINAHHLKRGIFTNNTGYVTGGHNLRVSSEVAVGAGLYMGSVDVDTFSFNGGNSGMVITGLSGSIQDVTMRNGTVQNLTDYGGSPSNLYGWTECAIINAATNILFENITWTNCNRHVTIQSGTDIKFVRNTFNGFGTNLYINVPSVMLFDGNNVAFNRRTLIQESLFQNCSGQALRFVANDGNLIDCHIFNNDFRDGGQLITSAASSGFAAVRLDAAGTGAKIMGNTVTNWNGGGIEIVNGKDVCIQRNWIFGSPQLLLTNATGISVVGTVGTLVPTAMVTGNFINYCPNAAITLLNVQEVDVYDNRILTNCLIQTTAAAMFVGISGTGATTNDLPITSLAGGRITDNVIRGVTGNLGIQTAFASASTPPYTGQPLVLRNNIFSGFSSSSQVIYDNNGYASSNLFINEGVVFQGGVPFSAAKNFVNWVEADPLQNVSAFFVSKTANVGANPLTGNPVGLVGRVVLAGTGGGVGFGPIGVLGIAQDNQGGTNTLGFGIGVRGQYLGSGTNFTTLGTGVEGFIQLTVSNILANGYALRARNPSFTATGYIGTATGLQIDAQHVAGSTNVLQGYGVHQVGADDTNSWAGISLFGGNAFFLNRAIYFGTNTTEVAILTGNNTPEGVEPRPVGSLFLRLNGGAGTTLYVKESGTGNTGWVAK